MQIPTPKVDTICLVGDHHGMYTVVRHAIKQFHLHDTLFIHVGDGGEAGARFPELLTDLDRLLRADNNHYWSIRGNHTDPAFFQGDYLLDNVKLLPDYSRATLLGEDWLFAGGAVSIDRGTLTMEKNWWAGEEFTPPPDGLKPCDILVTHSGPKIVTPLIKGPLVANYEQQEIELCGKSTLWEELEQEHREHEKLFAMVTPKKWYLGHFHYSLQVNHDGCDIRVLAASELLQHHD